MFKKHTALLAGAFDPPHFGHLDLIKRAASICDKLVVCIASNPNKKAPLLSKEERVELLQALTEDVENVFIVSHEGLLAKYALENEVDFFIRGVRSLQNFEKESAYATANEALSHKETVFLICQPAYQHISSTLVREILSFKGNLAPFVPAEAMKYLL